MLTILQGREHSCVWQAVCLLTIHHPGLPAHLAAAQCSRKQHHAVLSVALCYKQKHRILKRSHSTQTMSRMHRQ
jgi:hypothetical protein